MSLENLNQDNDWINKKTGLKFSKQVSLAIWAFVLSINLSIAEPNKTIWLVDFIEWGTAELYKDKNWNYGIRNWNSKIWRDFIYGTTIINGKKYIVYSPGIWYNIDVFLESDLEVYKEYLSKYGEKRVYNLVKSMEQYLENYLKDNPNSTLEEALKWWEVILKKLTK